MRILHVSLGLPPFRGGGLTFYARDLMCEQARGGHEVQLLYPGRYTRKSEVKIKQDANTIFEVHEILNPLPVPLLLGINRPLEYVKPVEKDVYAEYLARRTPDVIHVHTLMGIHREFFQAAATLGIKLVYTTHDYYGLCIRANFIDSRGQLCERQESVKCAACCAKAGLPMFSIRFMQSNLYRCVKQNGLMKKIRSYVRTKKKQSTFISQSLEDEPTDLTTTGKGAEYKQLYDYYKSIFKLIDGFHFNSCQSEELYKKVLDAKGEVVSITLNNIKKQQGHRCLPFRNDSLHIGYIGSCDNYKGIEVLMDALQQLYINKFSNWKVHLYGDNFRRFPEAISNKIMSHGRYGQADLACVFHSMDLLVVPSIWKETFGLVVLEALSHGVPVLTSTNVGAKDLLKDAPIQTQFEPCAESLYEVLKGIMLNPKSLYEYQKWISEREFPFDMKKHSNEITKFYMRTIESA